MLEGLQGTYSDIHKDVYGFRPRNANKEQWNSIEWLQKSIEELSAELTIVIAKEEQCQQESIKIFEDKVLQIQKIGADSRETAVKWLVQAEEDVHAQNDMDYFCYLHNLPYGYLNAKTN